MHSPSEVEKTVLRRLICQNTIFCFGNAFFLAHWWLVNVLWGNQMTFTFTQSLLIIFQIFSFFQCGCPYKNQNWVVLGISNCIGYQFSKILSQNPFQKDFLLQYSDQNSQSAGDWKISFFTPWKIPGGPKGNPLDFPRTWIFPVAASSAVPGFFPGPV